MSMTEQEGAQLAAFLAHAGEEWTLRRTPEARKDIERGFEDMCADQLNEVIWKAKHDELAERFDRAVAHAAAEAEADRRILRRVRQFMTANRARKTVSAEDLAVILSVCETCPGQVDATRLWHGRPMCEACYGQLSELARL
jgi:hypothetical protein